MQAIRRIPGEVLVRGATEVPYHDNAELPRSVREHLPEHAQTIYREAFNHAWVQYAHRVAWSAVKRKYHKVGDRWIAKD